MPRDAIIQSIIDARKASLDAQGARAQVLATIQSERQRAVERQQAKREARAVTARQAAEAGRREAQQQEQASIRSLANVMPQPQTIRTDEQGLQAGLATSSAGSIGGLEAIVEAVSGGAGAQEVLNAPGAGGAGGDMSDPLGINRVNPIEGGRVGTDIRHTPGGGIVEVQRSPLRTGIGVLDIGNALSSLFRGGRPLLTTDVVRERPGLVAQEESQRFREREFQAAQRQRAFSNRLQLEQFQALQDERQFNRRARQEELQLRRSGAKMELFSQISRNSPEMNTVAAAELADVALRQGPLAMAQAAEVKGLTLNQTQQVEFRAKQLAVDSAERTLANARARDERISAANTPLRTIFPTTAPNPNVPEFTDEARSLRVARINGELAKLVEASDEGMIPRSSSVRLAAAQQELVHDNRALIPTGVDEETLRGVDSTSTKLDQWITTVALANAGGFSLLGQFPPDQQASLKTLQQAAIKRLQSVGFLDEDFQVRNDPADEGSGGWAQVFRDQYDAAARAARTGYAKDIITRQLLEPIAAAIEKGDRAAVREVVDGFFGLRQSRGGPGPRVR